MNPRHFVVDWLEGEHEELHKVIDFSVTSAAAWRFSIAFALVGVILVLAQGSLEIIRTLSISKGDLLILAGNICWALYGILGRKYLKGSSSMETTTLYLMLRTAVTSIRPKNYGVVFRFLA